MTQRRILENDHLGCYRLKPEPPKKKKHREHQISPQILKILKSSGKSFDGVVLDDEFAVKSKASAIPEYRKPVAPITAGGVELDNENNPVQSADSPGDFALKPREA